MLRHLTAACLAAFFALNTASPRAGAKPPDLPDDDPIIVAVPEQAAPASGSVFLNAADFAVAITGEEECEHLSTMPKEESVCPHCAATPDRRALTGCDPKSMPSVLDNLRTLEKAAAEIDRARKLGAAGNYTEAIGHLDAARKLCPGSSYARRAEEVMAEIFGVGNPITLGDEQEAPCRPEGCCEPLMRIRNVGACYMVRIGAYCEKVQAVAKQGCCGEEGSACQKCETEKRTLTITVGVNSDGGLTGSIVLNERNSDCGKCCPAACACESACPKCEKMHRAVMKNAGVEEQVNGLLKACYFAVQEGRNAKVADLARQAHALDPKRVEADPLVYKLHMLAEEGQCEECETPREASPACPKCPTEPVEDNVSLRPELPGVDPEVVVALDRVLTKRGGDEEAEVVRPEFDVQVGPPGIEITGRLDSDAKLEGRIRAETASRQAAQQAKASCRPCCECAEAIGANLLGLFLSMPSKDCDRGVFVLGIDTQGINAYTVSKHAGVRLLIHYRNGLPLVWVQADAKPTAE